MAEWLFKGTMTDLFSPTIGTLLTVIMFLIANKKEGRKRSNLKSKVM